MSQFIDTIITGMDSPELWIAIVFSSFIGGFIRGFSGFGMALVALPIFGLFFDPAIFVPCMFVYGFICSIQLLPRIKSDVNWPQLKFIWLGYLLAVPVGIAILKLVQPDILRLIIATLMVVSLFSIIYSQRILIKLKKITSFFIGIISGITGGSSGIDGPPIVLYFNASQKDHTRNRASLVACFIVTTGLSIIFALGAGLYEAKHIGYLLLGIPAVILGNYIGAHSFSKANRRQYNILVYALILSMAILLTIRSLQSLL